MFSNDEVADFISEYENEFPSPFGVICSLIHSKGNKHLFIF